MSIEELAGKMRTKFSKDECGDYRIEGKRGNIHEDGKNFSIWFCFKTARMMNKVHSVVSKFCERRQNGDTEGVYFLKASAVDQEVIETILKLLKIRQKNEVSSENRAKAAERMRAISAKQRENRPI